MFVEFAIIGTTASGKSDIALELASEFGGIILSLDSLALYKQIDIASAKPSIKELQSVKHFGINLVYPNEDFSVGDFIKEYEKAKSHAQNLNTPLIITGGSGFYLKAMLSGLTPKIKDLKTDLSNEQIYELALRIDPEFTAKFSKRDTYRLRKWYSIYSFTGEIPSFFLKNRRQKNIISNLNIFEIVWDREILRDRIAKRTKKMVQNGLVDEAKFLFDLYGREEKALKCIGLKECAFYLDGEIPLSKLHELISIHTSQLAKRQRTFNKSQFIQNKFIQNYNDTKTLTREFLQSMLR